MVFFFPSEMMMSENFSVVEKAHADYTHADFPEHAGIQLSQPNDHGQIDKTLHCRSFLVSSANKIKQMSQR